jgi:hypothetical protein
MKRLRSSLLRERESHRINPLPCQFLNVVHESVLVVGRGMKEPYRRVKPDLRHDRATLDRQDSLREIDTCVGRSGGFGVLGFQIPRKAIDTSSGPVHSSELSFPLPNRVQSVILRSNLRPGLCLDKRSSHRYPELGVECDLHLGKAQRRIVPCPWYEGRERGSANAHQSNRHTPFAEAFQRGIGDETLGIPDEDCVVFELGGRDGFRGPDLNPSRGHSDIGRTMRTQIENLHATSGRGAQPFDSTMGLHLRSGRLAHTLSPRLWGS